MITFLRKGSDISRKSDSNTPSTSRVSWLFINTDIYVHKRSFFGAERGIHKCPGELSSGGGILQSKFSAGLILQGLFRVERGFSGTHAENSFYYSLFRFSFLCMERNFPGDLFREKFQRVGFSFLEGISQKSCRKLFLCALVSFCLHNLILGKNFLRGYFSGKFFGKEEILCRGEFSGEYLS